MADKSRAEAAMELTRQALVSMTEAIVRSREGVSLWDLKTLWKEANGPLQRAAFLWEQIEPGRIVNEIERDETGKAVRLWPFGKLRGKSG
jgi:hypothetical protein